MTKKSALPFKFHFYHCEGRKGQYGWEADGDDPNTRDELARRLSRLMIKRPREVIWASTPPKTRSVIRLDVEVPDIAKDPEKARKVDRWALLNSTVEAKMPAVCDNVVEGLGTGEKCIVWVYTKEAVEIALNAIEKAVNAKSVRRMMERQGVRIWGAHGDADAASRIDLANEFTLHQKAGVLVATMDSFPGDVTLGGASTAHFAQLHYVPGTMVQTENRSYLMGVNKLHVIYYIAIGTIDEDMEKDLLPRMETMKDISKDQDASTMSEAFARGKESIEDYFERILGRASENAVVDSGEVDITPDIGESLD